MKNISASIQEALLAIEQGSISNDLVHEAVHDAVFSDEIEHLNQLLTACASLDGGESMLKPAIDLALLTASLQGQTKVVRCLLNHVADVHYEGERPLLLAIRNAKTEVIRLLLECGADPNVKNGEPLRRLGLGYVQGRIEKSRCKSILGFLLNAGADLEKVMGGKWLQSFSAFRGLLSLCSIIAERGRNDQHWPAAADLVVNIGARANQVRPPDANDYPGPLLEARRVELGRLHRELTEVFTLFELPDHVPSITAYSQCL